MAEPSVEIWFYHLERSSLDQVLPELLERCRTRGWRALVQCADADRLAEIDDRLWTWRDDSFLAHGRAGGEADDRQPILLSETGENRNGAQALFIIDGSPLTSPEGYQRCFILFDGRDDDALHQARDRWRLLKEGSTPLAYWKQGEDGGWARAG